MISAYLQKLKALPDKKGAFLVGGAVRDLLLNRNPGDFDIAVSENAEAFARQLARVLKASFVPLGKPGQDLFRVVLPDAYYDITPLNGVNIEEDLKKRDFTINALGYSLEEEKMIDCTGGLADLKKKEIRMVSDRAFPNDPLRLLRTFRFGAVFGYRIAPGTLDSVRLHAPLIRQSAGERIRTELLKMFAAPSAFPYLKEMTDTGLLFEIIPEMRELSGCIQNRFHVFDVLHHTLNALESMEKILAGELWPESASPLLPSEEIRPLLKLTVLLHDVGKPPVRSFDPHKKQVHFYGHEKTGAEMAEMILKKLKFPKVEIRFVCKLIRGHLRPLLLFRAGQNRTLKQKGIIRFFMKSGEYTPLLLLHALADDAAKSEIPEKGEFQEFVKKIYGLYSRDFLEKKSAPPLLNGHDLIREFGLRPSPDFKRILHIVEEARFNGRIRSKEDALKLAKGCL